MYRGSLISLSNEVGLSSYLKQIKAIPILSEEEEYSLARKWRTESDIEAAQKLVLSHIKLVVKVAQKFKGYGLPLMDLISEGNIGLMKAVKKFDPDMGYRLATYAVWWIKATIQDYILKSWSIVKIGTSAVQKKLFFNLKKIQQRILQSDNNLDDVNTLAAVQLGVSKQQVDDMSRSISSEMLSLQDSIGESDDGNNLELLDFISTSDGSEEDLILELHDKNIMLGKLANAMNSLSDREREIIKARRLNDEPETLENLSSVYGVSRERVRQIEKRAMQKLKSYLIGKAGQIV